MLLFDTGENVVQVERDGIEAIAQEQLLNKLDEMRQAQPIAYQAIKTAVELMLTTTGVKVPVPKDVNKLDFLACYFLKLGVDMIDNKPIAVAATVVSKQMKETNVQD